MKAANSFSGNDSTICVQRLSDWPEYRNQPVQRWRITNASGLSLEVLSLGGIIRSLIHPDGTDIVLGCDCLEDYLTQKAYLGALVGRCANRIAFGRATIGGQSIQLPVNQPPHHLHGGPDGFDRRHFQVEPQSDGVRLSLLSPDNDQGYPGQLKVGVEYRLGKDNTVSVEMVARSDAPTLVNLTQHTYFNLTGAYSPRMQNCLQHTLQIAAEAYLPVGPDLIPSGEIADVVGTPFDFRSPRSLLQGMNPSQREKNAQIAIAKGYDHCFVLSDTKTIKTVAQLGDPDSGRRLRIATDQPGIQVYSGNYLGGTRGKNGGIYDDYCGVALECQNWPDAVNQRSFPTPIVTPEKEYRHHTCWEIV